MLCCYSMFRVNVHFEKRWVQNESCLALATIGESRSAQPPNTNMLLQYVQVTNTAWSGRVGCRQYPVALPHSKVGPPNKATEQVQFWYIISENHLSANYHSDNGCSTDLSFVYNVAEQEGKTLPFLRSHCAIPPTLFVGRRIILPTGNWQNQRQNADQILEATWEWSTENKLSSYGSPLSCSVSRGIGMSALLSPTCPCW